MIYLEKMLFILDEAEEAHDDVMLHNYYDEVGYDEIELYILVIVVLIDVLLLILLLVEVEDDEVTLIDVIQQVEQTEL